jgi:hypothetical protein
MGEDYVLFCSIDSKAEGWKHGELRKQKKLTGLPSIAFLDGEGRVLIRLRDRATGWRQFGTFGRKAERYVRLRSAAAKGDKKAKAGFLRMQLNERQLTLATALEIREEIADSVPQGTAENLDREILHLRISEELRAKGHKRRHELGPRFYRMWKKGPKPGEWVGRGFWFAILEWAEREKKIDEFAEAIEGLRRSIRWNDGNPAWAPKLLGRYHEKLKKLRERK